MKYYISDTHFGHSAVIDFEKEARPFASIEEHDAELVLRWNNVVTDKDTVYHLGDVAFKPATTLQRIMPLLNGKKKLAKGNHDTAALKNYTEYFTSIQSVFENKKKGILFSHYPVHPSQLVSRYKYNVHGHTHSEKIKDPRYLCVSCEQTNLTPISEDEVLRRLAAQMPIVVTDADIGRRVKYGSFFSEEDYGIVTSYNSDYVFVAYSDNKTSQATNRGDLEYVD